MLTKEQRDEAAQAAIADFQTRMPGINAVLAASDAIAKMQDVRMPPQYHMRNLIPKAEAKPQPYEAQPMVWWRVKLRGDKVTVERDIRARTEDAREIANYVALNYPNAECVSIRRMKRSP